MDTFLPTNLQSNQLFKRWLTYFAHFLATHRISLNNKKGIAAVSGGRDSVFLLISLWALKKHYREFELEVVHFNHGTRVENKKEERFVCELAKELELPIRVVKLALVDGPNFEKRARDAREHYYKQDYQNHLVFFGHHLDDSFEWALMSQLKGSNISASLGMPLQNKNKLRPLLCLSRSQITNFVKKLHIPFMDDPTNKFIKYERNALRQVILRIKKSYPSYLRNYVYRANQLAFDLNLHQIKKTTLVKSYLENGAIKLFSVGGFRPHQDAIKKAIAEQSSQERGRISKEIVKLIDAAERGKKGPMHFSGGVLVKISRTVLEIHQSCKKS